ncbi:hypothetical protein B1L04_02905 [Microcystis aeruginosa KW]|jgi:uncharacterized protein YndB with AHSA1/START domain|uniref:Activator of Hsp90 ATPase homologue 1/2-like C-terminal domain-containing protein n=1 Tax=Microcystis aeruginosa KW TaxID=1960155 RepID=A0A1V4BYD3_MICAE|nr:SRPBCC domain-containing protein [Microcystis aeruginosa]NCS31421.1 hypothetical protein [Microcystis aeruginosa F13-15]OPF19749.1 hypothetical protein B1L04_02905 [Microcystis aeruginosa KW]
MIASASEARVGVSPDPSRVIVTLATSVSAAQVWQALTETSSVAMWFGSLTAELRPGSPARLDFGDGDFFTLDDIQLNPPYGLQYTWRFLGIGPKDAITWRIIPQDAGCLVTVSDDEPERALELSQDLQEGWLDFIQRLERFLTTGQVTRYDWRREFEASLELPDRLPDIWDSLFDTQEQAHWLPLADTPLASDAHFEIDDGLDPTRWQITEVLWNPPTSVQFQLSCPDWRQFTRCYLELFPRPQTTLLRVKHLGWEGISRNEQEAKRQRQRFSELWIKTLQQARQIVEPIQE